MYKPKEITHGTLGPLALIKYKAVSWLFPLWTLSVCQSLKTLRPSSFSPSCTGKGNLSLRLWWARNWTLIFHTKINGHLEFINNWWKVFVSCIGKWKLLAHKLMTALLCLMGIFWVSEVMRSQKKPLPHNACLASTRAWLVMTFERSGVHF